MISMFPALFSFYGEKMGNYPWWITLLNLIIHFLAIKKCIKMDDDDIASPLKDSHNTIHTFFWLAVMLMLPGLGVILYVVCSYFVYVGWEMEKEPKNNFNLNCKLFLGNDAILKSSYMKSFFVRIFRGQNIAKKYLYSGLENSELTEYDLNAQGKKQVHVKVIGSFFRLLAIFVILLIVSLVSYIKKDMKFDQSFNYPPFLTALCFYAIIVVHDWYYNYHGRKMFFRIVWLKGTQPWREAKPILGKYHSVEYDYCNSYDIETAIKVTGSENIKVVSPTELIDTVDSIVPEFFNTYTMVSAASECCDETGCRRIRGNSDFAIEFLDPTYSYDMLDVKKVERLSALSSVTRYVYLDWYHGQNNVYVNWDNTEKFEEYSENEDVRCLERTIYSVSPKFKYLFGRAVVYFLIIWLLFSPMSYSWHTGFINLCDSILSKIF